MHSRVLCDGPNVNVLVLAGQLPLWLKAVIYRNQAIYLSFKAEPASNENGVPEDEDLTLVPSARKEIR